jgi:hypothetical protein
VHELVGAVLLAAILAFVARWLARGYETSQQRAARRALQADPWVSKARHEGFALTDAIDASSEVETAAREAAETARAACREADGEPAADREALRERLDLAATAAESAADQAATLARRIRLHDSEITRAAESSPRGAQVLSEAGSEAMEYRPYAAETASSLDGVADEARRAAAAARARGSSLSRS